MILESVSTTSLTETERKLPEAILRLTDQQVQPALDILQRIDERVIFKTLASKGEKGPTITRYPRLDTRTENVDNDIAVRLIKNNEKSGEVSGILIMTYPLLNSQDDTWIIPGCTTHMQRNGTHWLIWNEEDPFTNHPEHMPEAIVENLSKYKEAVENSSPQVAKTKPSPSIVV